MFDGNVVVIVALKQFSNPQRTKVLEFSCHRMFKCTKLILKHIIAYKSSNEAYPVCFQSYTSSRANCSYFERQQYSEKV